MPDNTDVHLSQDELKVLIRDAIRAYDQSSPRLTRDDIESVVQDTVAQMMTGMGLDHNNPLEIQQDFARLREWRLAAEKIKTKSMMVILGIVIAGGAAALWVGFKIMVGKIP